MGSNRVIRITLKESRGDGDVVSVLIDNEDCVFMGDGYIRVLASDKKKYLFTLHNILYYKIYEVGSGKLKEDETNFKDINELR